MCSEIELQFVSIEYLRGTWLLTSSKSKWFYIYRNNNHFRFLPQYCFVCTCRTNEFSFCFTAIITLLQRTSGWNNDVLSNVLLLPVSKLKLPHRFTQNNPVCMLPIIYINKCKSLYISNFWRIKSWRLHNTHRDITPGTNQWINN